MPDPKIAFIGGSGLYDIDGMENRQELTVETPFGDPSDAVVVGEINGVEAAFLPRHGRGHRFSPSEIPVKANIYALKSLGVERVVSVSAVGSLKEHIKPLDLVVPDQIIDRTRRRSDTFFGDGIVAHVGFADPFCNELRRIAFESASLEDVDCHDGGTYLVIEGPQFSTRAESAVYRSWGANVIGMTALPEAKLAREAELCYTTLAFVTDYDVWHDTEEEVTVEMVIQNLTHNVATAQGIIRRMLAEIPDNRTCGCESALKNAVITSRESITKDAQNRLGILVNKYLNA
ncbi:MAG TPA: S-methyl-5'-thioadenosine phosphorylase [Dehalococcoidia bacterium]|nr:S-methyl-5'-thioadenosine phosphorylase [Dehalococcoidia bacterium]HIM17929.1 S-methyl-5'-thioadenosine phosphorylase [Dehalococcoidia bacterium]HIM89211.1 S-methyl-5'-thioadenosine phosphorylase [Dehalococcoidia bacterium]